MDIKAKSKLRVGVLKYRFNYYTNLRIILHKLPEADYVPVKDIYSLRRSLALRVNSALGRPLIPTFDLNNQFEDFDLNKVDILHFSNGVSYGKTPWVSSFETILPRFSQLVTRHHGAEVEPIQVDALIRRGLDALAGPACKQIIAWSQCSANIQKDLLEALPPEYGVAILPKMRVLHPSQEVLLESKPAREYNAENPIRFVMVGAAFFRKGGREMINAFRRLAEEDGLPVKLVIVSSLRIENYAAQETEADVAWAREVLTSGLPWIEYYPSLPNAEVLELLKGADVGLLPTWADTYGLSILEAQGCACPVISTDIRALPEMNDNLCGWLIRVPKNKLGEALYVTPEDRALLSQTIEEGLVEIIRGIAADPQIIAVKGAAAVEKIRARHDPAKYKQTLREIYQRGSSR